MLNISPLDIIVNERREHKAKGERKTKKVRVCGFLRLSPSTSPLTIACASSSLAVVQIARE
jgi:hypothetical protein